MKDIGVISTVAIALVALVVIAIVFSVAFYRFSPCFSRTESLTKSTEAEEKVKIGFQP